MFLLRCVRYRIYEANGRKSVWNETNTKQICFVDKRGRSNGTNDLVFAGQQFFKYCKIKKAVDYAGTWKQCDDSRTIGEDGRTRIHLHGCLDLPTANRITLNTNERQHKRSITLVRGLDDKCNDDVGKNKETGNEYTTIVFLVR